MSRTDNLCELPKTLPVPTDESACRHLPGMQRSLLHSYDLTKARGLFTLFRHTGITGGRPRHESRVYQ